VGNSDEQLWGTWVSVISIVIAVFGMRLLLPLVIVWAAAGLPPFRPSSWR